MTQSREHAPLSYKETKITLKQIASIADRRIAQEPMMGIVNRTIIEKLLLENSDIPEFHGDGFYRISSEESLISGNYGRISTFDGKKTFWYPADLEKAGEDVTDMMRIVASVYSDKIIPLLLREQNKKTLDIPEIGKLLDMEDEYISRCLFVDIGGGDGRVSALASLKYGFQSRMIEIDPMLCELARINDNDYKEVFNHFLNISYAGIEIIQGNLFDLNILNQAFLRDREYPRIMCFMNLGHLTHDAILTILPYLSTGDCIMTHKQSDAFSDKDLKKMRKKLLLKYRRSGFLGYFESHLAIYQVK